jgi:hypothetical protein
MPETELATIEVFTPEVVPQEIVQRAAARAKALMSAVRKQNMSIRIAGREYLRAEAWQLLGAFYGMTTVIAWTREERDEQGKLLRAKARAEVFWRGRIIGAAESECSRFEEMVIRDTGEKKRRWEEAVDSQILGMAQTRACARALRQILGWVASLAGYAPTPAEEMDQLDLLHPEQKDRRGKETDTHRG